ncbi:MAG: fibronectin type III domain-containing protein [Terracidiphilus sp.]|nr:fibronectin type III domain-containing protein [Terracidiphilus sp.]
MALCAPVWFCVPEWVGHNSSWQSSRVTRAKWFPLVPSDMLLPLLALLALTAAQDAPQALRIAFRGKGTDMVVSWTTVNATSDTTVKYGNSAANLTMTATGTTSTCVPPRRLSSHCLLFFLFPPSPAPPVLSQLLGRRGVPRRHPHRPAGRRQLRLLRWQHLRGLE